LPRSKSRVQLPSPAPKSSSFIVPSPAARVYAVRGLEDQFHRARYPSGKGEVCKTFMRRFDSDPRLQQFCRYAPNRSGPYFQQTSFCASCTRLGAQAGLPAHCQESEFCRYAPNRARRYFLEPSFRAKCTRLGAQVGLPARCQESQSCPQAPIHLGRMPFADSAGNNTISRYV
jgi:hypothetical protein